MGKYALLDRYPVPYHVYDGHSPLIGGAATFTVIGALNASDHDLLPGMTGRVEISGDR